MPAIDFLYFDAAFTLMVPHPSVGEVYAAEAGLLGCEASGERLNTGFRLAWKAARAGCQGPPYGQTDAEARAFWRRVVEGAFREAQYTMPDGAFFDGLYEKFATADCWRVPDDVSPAIARAKAMGVGIGVLSNFDVRLPGLLEALELADVFDHVVISCQVGAEKPDPAIFAAAQAACGAAPARIGMVGDGLSEDFHGPDRAGWRACLVDRDGLNREASAPAFADLVSAVEYLLA